MTTVIVLVLVAAAFAGLMYWRKQVKKNKPAGYSYDPDQDVQDPLNPGPQPPNPRGLE
jgi:hypothetical protein